MNPEELKKTFPPDWYLEDAPVAGSGLLDVNYVMVRCTDVADVRVGIVLERGGFAVYIPLDELPVLSDVLGGIVKRARLS